MDEPNVRICICHCGRVGVQEVDEDPLCYKCGASPEDWFNLDAGELKEDLINAVTFFNAAEDNREPVSTETKTVTGWVGNRFEDRNKN